MADHPLAQFLMVSAHAVAWRAPESRAQLESWASRMARTPDGAARVAECLQWATTLERQADTRRLALELLDALNAALLGKDVPRGLDTEASGFVAELPDKPRTLETDEGRYDPKAHAPRGDMGWSST